MNSGINLAGIKVDPAKLELERRVKRFRIAAFVVLFVVCLASVILFVIIIASPLPGLRAHEEELFLALNSQNSKIQRLVFVDKQLGHVERTIETRSNIPDVIEEVMASAPPGLSVESYTASSDRFEVAVVGQSLTDFQEFVDQIAALSTEKSIFQNVAISEVSYSASRGLYSMRISMNK